MANMITDGGVTSKHKKNIEAAPYTVTPSCRIGFSNSPFYEFWSQVMQRLEFLLVPVSLKDQPPYSSLRCFGINNGFAVLFDNGSEMIGDSLIESSLIATIDTSQPNRAFIGLSGGYLGSIVGGIRYFDENGNQVGPMKLFCDIVMENRASAPRTVDTPYNRKEVKKQNLFLCGNVLLHTYIPDSMDELAIAGVAMSQDEQITHKFLWHRPDLKVGYSTKREVCLGRWLCLHTDLVYHHHQSKDKSSDAPAMALPVIVSDGERVVCVDMQSMHCVVNNKDGPPVKHSHDLVYDEVQLQWPAMDQAALDVFNRHQYARVLGGEDEVHARNCVSDVLKKVMTMETAPLAAVGNHRKRAADGHIEEVIDHDEDDEDEDDQQDQKALRRSN